MAKVSMNIRNINITNGYFNFDQNKFLLEKMKSAKLSLKKPNLKLKIPKKNNWETSLANSGSSIKRVTPCSCRKKIKN